MALPEVFKSKECGNKIPTYLLSILLGISRFISKADGKRNSNYMEGKVQHIFELKLGL